MTTASILDQQKTPGEITPELARHLNALANKNNLNVIIWVRSYEGPRAFKIAKNPIELQGYGLFTRELLLSKKAFAYANIDLCNFSSTVSQNKIRYWSGKNVTDCKFRVL